MALIYILLKTNKNKMLYEQEISSNINLNEIIRKLSHQKNEISLDNNIIINYFGDRKNLKRIFNSNKAKDSLINFWMVNNIYIPLNNFHILICKIIILPY